VEFISRKKRTAQENAKRAASMTGIERRQFVCVFAAARLSQPSRKYQFMIAGHVMAVSAKSA
jgi:hypothetical protein